MALAVLLVVSHLNIFAGPELKKSFPLRRYPLVSILIPARNEARNIADCLEGLLQQSYQNMEILLLDDESSDNTADIARSYCRKDRRIRLIEGRPLPSGWTGKNWACHQLSQHAGGEILIFTDADNRYHPRAVHNTLGWMQHYRLGMLSAFPQQITKTFAEKLVIPVIDILLYTLLPLWKTYRSARSSLAAANGQWIAFTRDAYQHIGGHRAVKNWMVEDIELSRRAKSYRLNILTLAGTGIVFGRMYRSIGEIWNGLSRSLFGLVSYRSYLFFAILTSFFLISVLPYLLLIIPGWLPLTAAAIALNLYLRLILAIKYRHHLLESVIFHPLAVSFVIAIGINSFLQIKQNRVFWKNRQITTQTLNLRNKSWNHRIQSNTKEAIDEFL
ncbi:MAG: glycosyltransferase family 2 protein [Calditrichia bacterium]